MERSHKIVILVLVSLFLAGGVLLFVLKSRLVPEAVEDILIARLAKVIEQPVSFAGLDIGLWGTITIRDISIGDTLHPSVPLLRCPHVVLHYSMFSLLSKKVVINKVTLHQPEVMLGKNVEEYFAFMNDRIPGGEMDMSEKGDAANGPDHARLSFVISQLRVEDGGLSVKETPEPSAHAFTSVLSHVDLTLADISPVSPFSLNCATRISSFPSSRVHVNAVIDPSTKRVTSSLKIQGDQQNACTLQAESTVELKDKSLLIKPLDVISGDSVISVTGELKNFFSDQLTGQLNVTSPAVVMDEIISCLGPAGNEGEMGQEEGHEENRFEESGVMGLFLLEGAAIDADLTLDSIRYGKISLTGVEATCSFHDKGIDLELFRGTVGDGLLSGKGHVGSTPEGVDYSLHLTGKDVELNTLVKAVSSDIQGTFRGLTDVTVHLEGRGGTQESFKKNLKGEGDFLIKGGSVSDIEFLKSLSSFIQIDKLDTLTFDHAYGTFTVADELIHTSNSFTGQEVELYPEGTVSLDAYVNLALKMKISPSLSEQIVDGVLTKYFVDEKGWTVLDLSIKGPSGDVVIMPASSTIKSISEMLVDILLKKEDGSGAERENKREALEKLLKKLMKRSSGDGPVHEGSASVVQ